jgi:hypothetical protein
LSEQERNGCPEEEDVEVEEPEPQGIGLARWHHGS